MSTLPRALFAAAFVLVATAGAHAQAPGHSGAVAIGSDNASGAPVARPQAVHTAPVQNNGAVAIGADSASGQPARQQGVRAPHYQGATTGARAIGSDR